jgi:hypothetical protein
MIKMVIKLIKIELNLNLLKDKIILVECVRTVVKLKENLLNIV